MPNPSEHRMLEESNIAIQARSLSAAKHYLSIITVNPLNGCDDRSRLEAEGSHIKP